MVPDYAYARQISDLLEEIEQALIELVSRDAPDPLTAPLSADMDTGLTLMLADLPDNTAYCDWKQDATFHLDDAGVWLADHEQVPVTVPAPTPLCGACKHDSAQPFAGCECACHEIFAVVMAYPYEGGAA